MTVERHYEDEALISFLQSGQSSARRDHHLATCRTCSEALASFEAITEVLGLEAAWDLRELRAEPVPSTIATLRAFADQMASEDVAAELFVKELLAGSRETWMPRLQQRPELRTAGVVRKLIEATDHALDTMPPDAVEITNLAVEIAEGLDPAAYASDTVMKLRGAAWRERAYALYFVSSYAAALAATEQAQAALQSCGITEHDVARLDLVRALIYRGMEQYDEAVSIARRSAAFFLRAGDTQKRLVAESVEAATLVSIGDHRSALRLWLEAERVLGPDASPHELVSVLPNIGYCYRELGQVEQAISYFTTTTAILEAVGAESEVVRVRANIAVLLLDSGRHAEALREFNAVRDGFVSHGLLTEAAIMNLYLAELLLAQEDYDKVAPLCEAAMRWFSDAGVPYSSRARTALAYIAEASQNRKATPVLAREVRTYVRRLPQQPMLLFAPAF